MIDHGAFTPVGVAATAALGSPRDLAAEFCPLCRRLRGFFIKGLTAIGQTMHGLSAKMAGRALFSRQLPNVSSIKLAESLLSEAKSFAVSGIGFDECGDARRWVSPGQDTQRIRQAILDIKVFLSGETADS